MDVCGDHRGDALESVGGEGAAESKAPVDADAGRAVAVVPQEALRPEVGELHRAEPVGGLGVDDVRRCSEMIAACGVADGEAPGVILRAGQVGAALVRLNASVDGGVAAVAAVGGDPRLEVRLGGGFAAVGGGDEAGTLLHDDAAR